MHGLRWLWTWLLGIPPVGLTFATFAFLRQWYSPKARPHERYLQELRSAEVDYVDKKGGRKLVGMQNIPLVYGDSTLGSANWDNYRPELQDGWLAEQWKAQGVVSFPTPASGAEDMSGWMEPSPS